MADAMHSIEHLLNSPISHLVFDDMNQPIYDHDALIQDLVQQACSHLVRAEVEFAKRYLRIAASLEPDQSSIVQLLRATESPSSAAEAQIEEQLERNRKESARHKLKSKRFKRTIKKRHKRALYSVTSLPQRLGHQLSTARLQGELFVRKAPNRIAGQIRTVIGWLIDIMLIIEGRERSGIISVGALSVIVAIAVATVRLNINSSPDPNVVWIVGILAASGVVAMAAGGLYKEPVKHRDRNQHPKQQKDETAPPPVTGK